MKPAPLAAPAPIDIARTAELVIADIRQRIAGASRQPGKACSDRDPLRDTYEAALDRLIDMRQKIADRDAWREGVAAPASDDQYGEVEKTRAIAVPEPIAPRDRLQAVAGEIDDPDPYLEAAIKMREAAEHERLRDAAAAELQHSHVAGIGVVKCIVCGLVSW